MFWLTAVMLGPIQYLDRPQGLLLLVIWVAVVFVSILLHELGHALMQKKFGAWGSRILLWGWGGVAFTDGGVGYTKREHILCFAAGPVVSLGLSGMSWVIGRAYPPIGLYSGMLLSFVFFANLVWGLFNLLPALPLDGGYILYHASNRRQALTGLVGVICCAAAVLLSLYFFTGITIFQLLVFGFLIYYNAKVWKGQWFGGGFLPR